MALTDTQSLVEFIQKRNFNCAYELIILFSAIKLKDEEGLFDKKRLIDFFIAFYTIREYKQLSLEKYCNPLQDGNRDKTIQLLNRNPIGFLLKMGIFKTFARFEPNIFQIIFDNEEEILIVLKERIIRHYSETFGDSKEILEELLSSWEKKINRNIKSDAQKKLGECYDKIDLEFFVKYLYQSCSLSKIHKLIESFHINKQEFINFFSTKFENPSQFFQSDAKETPTAAAGEVQEVDKSSPGYLRKLTSVFQQMREEPLEEEEEQEKKSKKKKKKKKK